MLQRMRVLVVTCQNQYAHMYTHMYYYYYILCKLTINLAFGSHWHCNILNESRCSTHVSADWSHHRPHWAAVSWDSLSSHSRTELVPTP